MTKQSKAELLEMTTDIVSSFVANNPIPSSGHYQNTDRDSARDST